MKIAFWLVLLAAVHLACRLPYCSAAEEGALSREQTLRLGERMFRDGILPSGAPMDAAVTGDKGGVPGTTFTCASCHLRSGLGAFDEGLYVPPVNGPQLFKPFQIVPESMERGRKGYPVSRRRPPYTEATLADAVRSGVDPAGRKLADAMPRYHLADSEMRILTSYLRNLSSDYSPGASRAGVRFATVITEDVPREDGDAMLISLLGFFDARSRQARLSKQITTAGKGSFALMRSDLLTSAAMDMSLSIWQLKGPPDTWRGQLEEYYRNDPVFALVGGISTREWEPIHRFSEENRIPCLFPNTDFPVISRNDWYTLYFSKGYYEEGEAAARFLDKELERLKGSGVVQIFRDSREGKALASGFLETWRELGHEIPVTLKLSADEGIATERVRKLLAKEKPEAVLLWDGPAALPALEALATQPDKPQMIFLSSSYTGTTATTLNRHLREIIQVAERPRFSRPTSEQGGLIAQMLSLALMDLKGNYYRDHLLDIMGMMGDLDLAGYGRLSFSPAQRYASKGGRVVRAAE